MCRPTFGGVLCGLEERKGHVPRRRDYNEGLKVATWNVNGIRARAGQVADWLQAQQPDVVCLQEIKAAPLQVPELLLPSGDYWARWHGAGGYSGVALLIRKALAPEEPAFGHPGFDFEQRVVMAAAGGITLASVYVPNGGKDLAAKLRFLEALRGFADSFRAAGRPLILCGDMNVARAEIDVHPRERKPAAIGQLPEERKLFDGLLGAGLMDVQRMLHPDTPDLYTWWAPWRNLRQRNIGWRIDYILASEPVARRARVCEAFREIGTSDHAPLVMELGD